MAVEISDPNILDFKDDGHRAQIGAAVLDLVKATEVLSSEPRSGSSEDLRRKGSRSSVVSATRSSHFVSRPQADVIQIKIWVSTGKEGEVHESVFITEGADREKWGVFVNFTGDQCDDVFVRGSFPNQVQSEGVAPEPEEVLETVLANVRRVIARFNEAVPVVPKSTKS